MQDGNTQNDNETTQYESWKVTPLERHLSTIGIGEVFLSPPPSETLFHYDLSGSSTKISKDDDNGDHDTSGNLDDSTNSKTVSLENENPILTWEITGILKSSAEDFVVREIGGCRKQDCEHKDKIQVANLNENNHDNDTTTSAASSQKSKSEQSGEGSIRESKDIVACNDENSSGDDKIMNTDENTSNNTMQKSSKSNMTKDDKNKQNENPIKPKPKSSKEIMMDILNNHLLHQTPDETVTKEGAVGSNGSKGSSIYLQIQNLHKEALENIILQKAESRDNQEMQGDNDDTNTPSSLNTKKQSIIIPPILDSDVDDMDNNTTGIKSSKGMYRGMFHRAFKTEFPLLTANTMSEDESQLELRNFQGGNILDRIGGQKKDEESTTTNPIPNKGRSSLRCIKIEADTSFHLLIPHLAVPQIDLPALYLFRNNGCVISSSSSKQHRESRDQGRNRKRKRQDQDRLQSNDPKGKNAPTDSNHKEEVGEVFLRLEPNLGKKERRDVHHLISASDRRFQTGTRQDVSLLPPNVDRGSEIATSTETEQNTTAIVVYWSSQAQRAASKKQKQGSTKTSNLLCVMKKTGLEHLVAMKHLQTILKCRQSDIGTAGIKDMRAVTYQFLTIQNISLDKVKRANNSLGYKGVVLGNFKEVDWHLNHGDLRGNEFEIVIQNIQRVKIKKVHSSDGDHAKFEEVRIPCHESHIDLMVERVKSGFINYFGEQRLGEGGLKDEVGVRPADIGRAMLKKDFTLAIHLLLSGRKKCRGDFAERPDIRKTRQVWIDSNGDAEETLRAFPKGNVMTRERTVLQGLIRYGKEKPLEVLRCLHFNVRMFWIHAYQSFIWNCAATQRIRCHGYNPVKGDLFKDKHDNGKISIVSDSNLSAITINDIVLPLPGHSILYPTNTIGDFYKQMLDEDGILFDSDSVPEATAKGGYRQLVEVPERIEWHDLNKNNDGNVGTAKFNFSLSSGSYATILLRELMVSTISR